MTDPSNLSRLPAPQEALIKQLHLLLKELAAKPCTPAQSQQMGYVQKVMNKVKAHVSRSHNISEKEWNAIIAPNASHFQVPENGITIYEAEQSFESLKDHLENVYESALKERAQTTSSAANYTVTALPTRGVAPEDLIALCEQKRVEFEISKEQYPTKAALSESAEVTMADTVRRLSYLKESGVTVIGEKRWLELLQLAAQNAENKDHEAAFTNSSLYHTLQYIYDDALLIAQKPTTECSDAQTPENLCELQAEALEK